MRRKYSSCLSLSERQGLWISPEGEAHSVIEHLLFVQHHPEVFGLSTRDVKGATMENLRNLAVKLIKDGWIRTRFLAPQGYLFELNRIEPAILDKIKQVLIDSKSFKKENIIIHVIKPKPRAYQGTVAEFFDRSLLKSPTKPKKGQWRLS